MTKRIVLILLMGGSTIYGIVTWNAPAAAMGGIGFGFIGGQLFPERRGSQRGGG